MNKPSPKIDPKLYQKLKQEAKNPYKALRQFIYFAFAASGLIGALIFLTQLAAGKDVTSTLPNLALQIGIMALMVWLFRLENQK